MSPPELPTQRDPSPLIAHLRRHFRQLPHPLILIPPTHLTIHREAQIGLRSPTHLPRRPRLSFRKPTAPPRNRHPVHLPRRPRHDLRRQLLRMKQHENRDFNHRPAQQSRRVHRRQSPNLSDVPTNSARYVESSPHTRHHTRHVQQRRLLRLLHLPQPSSHQPKPNRSCPHLYPSSPSH